MRNDTTPAKEANLSALSDLCTPWYIHVVATLRIADHIAAGTHDIKALAGVAECDAAWLDSFTRPTALCLICASLFLIGACSLEQYRQYIERDAAFQRRFQEIVTPEAGREYWPEREQINKE